MTKNRTEVADIDRSLYDFTYGEEGFERLDAGITPDIVREISAKKDEPQWMLDLRLKSLEIFNRFPDPTWGPSIEGLDMDNIVTYVKPNTDQKHDWESVPDDIKNTFERLGIPDAERSYLAGVGAQYDSELVYHNMQDTASKMGIVYSGIEEALHDPQWEPLIHEKFMTLIPPTDHKFAALHGAVQHAFLLLHAAIARGNPQIDLVGIRRIDKRRELRVHFGVDGDGIEQRRGHLEIIRQRHFAVHEHKPPIAELLKGRFGSGGRFRKHTCFV